MSTFYSFRLAIRQDLPMLRLWLRTSEAVRWWGDPEEEAALLESDLDEPRMRMWIVSFKTRPFAYAQDYAVHDWPQPHFDRLPPGSRAIDAFIGEPDMIGLGHGSAFLRMLAERLTREGAPVVAIDPAVDNLRARRAYRKAGFCGDSVAGTQAGPAILMIFEGLEDSPRLSRAGGAGKSGIQKGKRTAGRSF